MKRSKSYKEALESFKQEEVYEIGQALEILEKFPKKKFDESVEVHAKLNIEPTKTDQQVRGTVDLPHGTGKTKKIAAFTSTQEAEAKKAGADIVGGEDLIEKIATSKQIDFEVAVATPEMMPKLGKVARILGPRGLMPNPKTQTVGPKIELLIEGLKKGRASFKNDNGANVHQIVGKRSFTKEKLAENIKAFLDGLQASKPTAAKGKLVKNISISTSMSPSIAIKS
jgi:large subunit ribosomal protein L1